jgi:hypothetical protein
MDSQLIEILGRNRLIDELMRAGLEVSQPIRDRGIDLIAYADLDIRISSFVACPIQMKAASGRSFSINAKYEKFPNLIHASVWGLDGSVSPATYAFTQDEVLCIATEMGYTTTASWKAGAYSCQQPGRKLIALMGAILDDTGTVVVKGYC